VIEKEWLGNFVSVLPIESKVDMIEEKLKETLASLQQGIKNSDAGIITGSLRTLDELVGSHRSELDPQLVHYLSRRSYEKAQMFLEGKDGIPKGICGK
jgi:hypothetical protein